MGELLKMGKGEFFITGFMTKDKDGNELTMKNGGKYKKFRLMVTDRVGNSATIYDPIFGSDPEKVEQIVNSLGVSLFVRAFNAGKLELKELVGSGGQCIIGVKEREGFDPQNTIECYLRKDNSHRETNGAMLSYISEPQRQMDSLEQEQEDDVLPF